MLISDVPDACSYASKPTTNITFINTWLFLAHFSQSSFPANTTNDKKTDKTKFVFIWDLSGSGKNLDNFRSYLSTSDIWSSRPRVKMILVKTGSA